MPDGRGEDTRPRLSAIGCFPNSGVETRSREWLPRGVFGIVNSPSAAFKEPDSDDTRRYFATLEKSAEAGDKSPNVRVALIGLSRDGSTGTVLDEAIGEGVNGRYPSAYHLVESGFVDPGCSWTVFDGESELHSNLPLALSTESPAILAQFILICSNCLWSSLVMVPGLMAL